MKPRKIPEVLTPEEQAKMMDQLAPTNCLSKLRNLAIIRLMVNTGLRARETRELKTKNIDWHTGSMRIRTNCGKERVIWLCENDLLLLKDWIAHKPSSKQRPSSELVFTSLCGQKPICGRWLQKLVKRLANQAGIAKDIHPHTLRHTFAVNLLQKTKNLRLVQKALGHENIETTTIYTHIVDDELEKAMKDLGNVG